MSGSDEALICNLLYRYAELIDGGRFEDIITELFADAELVVLGMDPPRIGPDTMLKMLRRTTICYADGTPRTKHVITNPIIEVDPDGRLATCRSYYTVFQQTDSIPFQAILSGRYLDRFEKVDGKWRFAERDYTRIDFVGDVSQHVRVDLNSL